jgi:hypothetical protein
MAKWPEAAKLDQDEYSLKAHFPQLTLFLVIQHSPVYY